MVTKRFCDNCGKEVQYSEQMYSVAITYVSGGITFNVIFREVCVTCKDKIEKLLRDGVN